MSGSRTNRFSDRWADSPLLKVRQESQRRDVIEAIRRHRSFTVSSHVNPEGDALGSAIALASLLKRLGKRVVLAQDKGIPKSLRFLPRPVPVVSRPGRRVPAQVAMVVDVPLLSRTGAMQKQIEKTSLIVNIDHHVSNQRFAHVNWVDPKAAAVGQMIYRLYRAFGIRPSASEALCMYTSLVTDTGSFRYMSTTPAVHRITAELIHRGVSPLKVSQALYESRSPEDLRFLGKVLLRLRHSVRDKVAWIELPWKLLKRYRASVDVLDELVNFPRSIQSAEVAFILRERREPRKIRVSFRSKGNVDVDRIARQFGGGGHKAASGCTIEGTLAQARAKVLKTVRQALRKK